MFKEFLLKKMLASKLKDVPQADQEKIFKVIEKNPQLFETIAQEAQAKIAGGADQMTAMLEVMQKHQDELRAALES
jgi:hypothetical protein